MKYLLIAQNSQEAIVKFYGESRQEALNRFLSVYSSKGWKISLFDNETGDEVKVYKSTYR